MSHTVGQIAALLNLEYRGDGSRLLEKVSKWESADETSLVFLESGESKLLQAGSLCAACVIAPEDLAPEEMNVIFSKQPKIDFAKAAAYLHC